MTGVILCIWAFAPKTGAGLALTTGLGALVAVIAGLSLAGHSALVVFYAGRLALILIGYIGASLAASAFIWFAGAAGTMSDVSLGKVAGVILFSTYPIVFIVLVVAGCALPPAATTILISEFLGLRGWLFYAVAGVAIGLVATEVFVHAFTRGAAASPGMGFRAIMVGGGIAGGLAYWLAAGRLAGRWRAKSWEQLEEVPG